MADMLATDTTGKVQFAFKGARADIWHSKGQAMPDDATPDQMADEGGLNYNIMANKVRYNNGRENAVYPDMKALFHSASLVPLGLVSMRFEVVQPAQVRDLIKRIAKAFGVSVDSIGGYGPAPGFSRRCELAMKCALSAPTRCCHT